jgi:hypothetical protein
VRGRIRTIKPEVLKDEELWDLGVETGLPVYQAFTGLWCYADSAGRFEWRPRALKAEILPYWEGDFSRVLDALTTRGFLVRYACSGRVYGLVRTFQRHQVINNREAASEIPAPTHEALEMAKQLTRGSRVDDACPTPLVHAQADRDRDRDLDREGKGASDARAIHGDPEPGPPRAATAPLQVPPPGPIDRVLAELARALGERPSSPIEAEAVRAGVEQALVELGEPGCLRACWAVRETGRRDRSWCSARSVFGSLAFARESLALVDAAIEARAHWLPNHLGGAPIRPRRGHSPPATCEACLHPATRCRCGASELTPEAQAAAEAFLHGEPPAAAEGGS